MKRLLGVSIALCAASALSAVGAASGASWDERVFPAGSHLDFDQIAAAGPSVLPALIERGRELFKAKFTTVDGAGRPKATQAIIPTKRKNGVNPPFSRTSGPDSNSCFGCHNDPVVGGSADDVANVFVSEGFESAQFDSIDPSFSSERHTIALMGSGLVELLAREMTADLQAIRAAAIAEACATAKDAHADLVTKGVRFGSIVAHPDGIVDLDAIDGVDSDLIVQTLQPQGRVHVAAPVHHQRAQHPPRHGGGRAVRRPLDRQSRLRRKRRARRDHRRRRLGPGRVSGDVAAADGKGRSSRRLAAGRQGRRRDVRRDRLRLVPHADACRLKSLVFTDPAPYDMAGTLRSGEVKEPIRIDLGALPFARTLQKNDKGEWLIPLYSDLKRHLVVDETVNALGNELQAQRFVERDVFLTPRLWGVGSTAPYGHNGSFRMLDEIIAAHGGDARFARDAYQALDPDKRDDIIAFLRSLVIEAQ